ncbi:integrase, partial [Escherichia coli]|nr:integrase [Escherichia coli]
MSRSLRTNLILIIGSFYHYMITKHTMYNYIHYYCDYNLLLCHSRAISLKVLF